MKSGIYSITNKVNGKRYIGSTKNFEKRWKKHLGYFKKGNHHSQHLQRAWEKYGKENFEFKIICYVEPIKEKLIKIEQTFLDLYKSYDERFGYNVAPTAYSCLGIKRSEETKEKLSRANKGKHLSEDMKKMLSETRKGEDNPFFGRKHTEETKRKISEAQIGEKNHQFGKHLTKETKEKLSKKLSGENSVWFGRKHTEETKKKISEANKGKHFGKRNKIVK